MPRSTEERILIGNIAGHHFPAEADLIVTYHCRVGTCFGLYHVRKWLADREVFERDPRTGWAYDRWFTWPNGEPER